MALEQLKVREIVKQAVSKNVDIPEFQRQFVWDSQQVNRMGLSTGKKASRIPLPRLSRGVVPTLGVFRLSGGQNGAGYAGVTVDCRRAAEDHSLMFAFGRKALLVV